MHKLFLLFALLSGTVMAAPAPDFSVGDSKLSDLKGQVVYLDFWASWCKPCRKSFPWMNEMHGKYADSGFTILAVNLDSDSELAQAFLAKLPANFPIVYDPQGTIAQQYKLPGMPTSYLIDKSGELRVAHKGFFTDRAQQYEQEIISLLNETE